MKRFYAISILMLIAVSMSAQTAYHVKVDGDDSKDGKSWNNAFATIQKAIYAATNFDIIHVAKGTYFPDEGPSQTDNDRNSTFRITQGVQIYGGYEGIQDIYERNLSANTTILSGNIQQDDIAENNTYHVLVVNVLNSHLVTLDGLKITGGRANYDHFFDVMRRVGGGILNLHSSLILQNCTLIDNSAIENGGAVYQVASATITNYSNCDFVDNSANRGGAIYNDGVDGNCSPFIINCSFTAIKGTVIFNAGQRGYSSPSIINCFFGDHAGTMIYNDGSFGGHASPLVSNCVFKSNFQSLIVNESREGGEAKPVFNNCTFSAQTISLLNTGDNDVSCHPVFNNCIFWGGFLSVTNSNATSIYRYCIIKNGFFNGAWNSSLGTDGGNNTNTDPLFVDAGAGNFRLQCMSPALDAGDNSPNTTEFDPDGHARIVNGKIDIGAFESLSGIDHLPPKVKTKNITVFLNQDGKVSLTNTAVDDGSSDNCMIKSISVSPSSFDCSNIGVNTVTLTVTDGNNNTTTSTALVTVADNMAPSMGCRNSTVELDETGTGTIQVGLINNNSFDNCGISSIWLDKASFNCGNLGNNLVNLMATDYHNNSSSCTAMVNVVDKLPPIPAAKNVTVQLPATGHVAVTASQINNGSTDNCRIKSVQLNDSTFDCSNVGVNTIQLIVTDNSDNVSTCAATITIEDKIPPVINNLSATPGIIYPVNRKMVDVFVNYITIDNCPGTSAVVSDIRVVENGVGGGVGNTSPDWEIVDANHVRLRAERVGNGTGRSYFITVRSTDASGNFTADTTEVKVVHNIKSPISGQPFKVGSTVKFTGEFWDKPVNTHTAKWLVDDNNAGNGTVTEPFGNQNGKVTGSYKFNSTGVYKLQMNITDQTGITSYANTNGDLESIVVIYDPNGGYAYGGGWYQSQAGALIANPTATGKASFGFTVNYFKNSTYPKGETQFAFNAGDFEFNAVNFDYLVINNAMAQFKGTGKITGQQSGVGFTMTVTDGQLDGSGLDKIRMKIYNKNTNAIIYDNQPGANDATLPVQAVGANSSVVISSSNSNTTANIINQKVEMETNVAEISDELEINTFPNPSAGNFTINVKSSTKGKIIIQIIDVYGRVIETRSFSVGSTIQFGDAYRPGTYIVKVIQDKKHKEIKLIKLGD